jgi:hypothetical protein
MTYKIYKYNLRIEMKQLIKLSLTKLSNIYFMLELNNVILIKFIFFYLFIYFP